MLVCHCVHIVLDLVHVLIIIILIIFCCLDELVDTMDLLGRSTQYQESHSGKMFIYVNVNS